MREELYSRESSRRIRQQRLRESTERSATEGNLNYNRPNAEILFSEIQAGLPAKDTKLCRRAPQRKLVMSLSLTGLGIHARKLEACKVPFP
jgi:hypothetical protein